MSDIRKIAESRKVEREATQGPEWRQVGAQEASADALEGIRQDLTMLTQAMTELAQLEQLELGF